MSVASPHMKLTSLKNEIASLGSVLVAFSGGVDSSFLLKVCLGVLGEAGGRVLAVTARSSTYPSSELSEAISLASSMGARHMVIDSEELEIKGFASNPPDRCYHCKSELFGKLSDIARKEGLAAILDGTNADDLKDYRPGSKAAKELGVRSLLQENGLTKDEIRAFSRDLGLPTWGKPAFACLASRFPYGVTITRDKLKMVELAEKSIRELGFRQARVRHHGDVARIELEPGLIARAVEPIMAEKIQNALTKAGFSYVAVDILGYRTGSMNETLKPDDKA
ncbi:ATP-utilizing enzyme of the PP-loop superfamily [hydrothermal vent metagenome]|uniref:ATP-utilizing enzyme of the PP-loop superfamily n=1 Tax=hydrothermal vent metagenome TaxID=652676 RepID=A0A3B1CI28_9ZZZZ